GLVCGAGMCVASAEQSCSAGDAPADDASLADVHLGEAGCAWSYNPSNIDPCSFAGPVGDWNASNELVFDTDAASATGDAPPPGSIHVVLESGGREVVVVFVHSVQLTVLAEVHGSRPLLIYADDSASLTSLVFSPTTTTCTTIGGRAAAPGEDGDNAGAGGGGGGGSYGVISTFATPAGASGGAGGPGTDGDAGGNLGV